MKFYPPLALSRKGICGTDFLFPIMSIVRNNRKGG
jgi:hypothetical protein